MNISGMAGEHRFPFRVHFLASAYKQVRLRSAYRKCSFFFMFVLYFGVDVYLISSLVSFSSSIMDK